MVIERNLGGLLPDPYLMKILKTKSWNFMILPQIWNIMWIWSGVVKATWVQQHASIEHIRTQRQLNNK